MPVHRHEINPLHLWHDDVGPSYDPAHDFGSFGVALGACWSFICARTLGCPIEHILGLQSLSDASQPAGAPVAMAAADAHHHQSHPEPKVARVVSRAGMPQSWSVDGSKSAIAGSGSNDQWRG